MITLDIMSDPICPWCYIGKTLLDRALETRPDHPFAVAWHPFQLNPDMPTEGMDRRAYLEGKFGGKEAAVKFYAQIVDHAKNNRIELDVARITRTPNTLDAHRLIHWAGIEERQNAVVDGLFAAYFREGRDIGAPDILADIAQSAGMDGDMVARLLQGDADRAEIQARDAHSRKMGVTSVPTFIIGNRHVVPGAQPTELWQNVMQDLDTAPDGTHP